MPFGLGLGLNRLFLRGRGIDSALEFFGYFLGGTAFGVFMLFIEGWLVIAIFSPAASEWWYVTFFRVGAIANIVGIACCGLAGLLQRE